MGDLARLHLRMRSLVRLRCEGVALKWGMLITTMASKNGAKTNYLKSIILRSLYFSIRRILKLVRR
jgi:hypothetical protein